MVRTIYIDINLIFFYVGFNMQQFVNAATASSQVQHKSNLSSSADTHFARDTHMRIILGNQNAGSRNIKNSPSYGQDSSNSIR